MPCVLDSSSHVDGMIVLGFRSDPTVPRYALFCRAVMTSIDPDPAKRFQSALDMRRTLEFAGHWTVDATGMLYGEDARHTYRFEHTPAAGSNASLAAFKTNKASGRETRISQFTHRSLSKFEASKFIANFLKAVVEGKVA